MFGITISPAITTTAPNSSIGVLFIF